jgi:hypothetical protein
MKSHPFRASSILSVLILLVASGLTVTAQQPRPRQEPTPQQEKPLIPELAAPRELPIEARRTDVPRECMGIRPDVQMHDVADTFNPPGTPVTLSPALATYLSGKPLKGYDDKRVNMVFADSFKLRNCRVCYATLEIGVRHDQDLWTNDLLYVQGAPYSPSGVSFIYTGIWTPSDPNSKTLTLALPTAALNNYLFSTSTIPTFLDVFAQDDTDFDFVKLSVWYY